jgi:hypothetical protein
MLGQALQVRAVAGRIIRMSVAGEAGTLPASLEVLTNAGASGVSLRRAPPDEGGKSQPVEDGGERSFVVRRAGGADEPRRRVPRAAWRERRRRGGGA